VRMGHTTVQDGMTIDWDVDIPVDDGVVLKGDVFRPISGEPCPVCVPKYLIRVDDVMESPKLAE
jgi:predicted acyl esterase